jgi:hypothetical protein
MRKCVGEPSHRREGETSMKKFMALYLAPISAIEQMNNTTPEQAKAGMQEWARWGDVHQRSIVDMGAPLGKTKKVTSEGVSDTRNDITGYSIVEADSLESAAEIFANHPHFKMGDGVSIEIIEAVALPEMQA